MIAWSISGRHEPYQARPIPRARGLGRVLRPRPVTDATSPPARGAEPESLGGAAYRRSATRETVAQPAVLARQVMSHPVATIRPDADLDDARQQMVEGGFRHLPVVSSSEELLGMVSDRDVLGARDEAACVAQVMSDRVLTASPDTAIRDIARVMVTERVGSLPLVNDAGVLQGIVTQHDLLRCVLHRAPLDLWIR